MSENLEWRFTQLFGEAKLSEEAPDADTLSAVEFDDTGDYIAVGDRGGRIVIFEREEKTEKANSYSKTKKVNRNPDYKFYTDFQSHEAEFDYLKSLEIEEKINKIKWCKRRNNAHFLLSTNDKTIKLWKIYEKKVKSISYHNTEKSKSEVVKSAEDIVFPTVDTRETKIMSATRRVFSNAHAYHVNSISLNSDGETYISSDDLRINLWNIGISDESFNIVDIKPNNMEELIEVITCAEFHPIHCNLFMYSTSKGVVKLADMRASALCDIHAKVYEEHDDGSGKSFFSEIISSISDIKFSRDGRFLLSRDYMTLKLWDLNMENKPIKTVHVYDYLKPKLCDLYEHDFIFDKFECTLSYDGSSLLTGSYHNFFNIYDRCTKNEAQLEATKVASKIRKPVKMKPPKKKSKEEINPDTIDFTKKIMHVSWHPSENLIAIAAANNLYIFNA